MSLLIPLPFGWCPVTRIWLHLNLFTGQLVDVAC